LIVSSHSKPAFHFLLDLQSGMPVYRQIIDQIRGALASGALATGDQLPTVRQLAVDLAINPNTVVRAYKELELGGLLETHQGTGTFISAQKARKCGAASGSWDRLWLTPSRAPAPQVSPSTTLWSSCGPGPWASPEGERMTPKITTQNFNGVAVAAFLVCFVAGVLTTVFTRTPTQQSRARFWPLSSLRHQGSPPVGEGNQATLRSLRGPPRTGVFLIVPVIETLSQIVDQRVRVANVSAETTLTRDTVPVNVDAIVFWMVWNAEKAILEVENYDDAITMSAQTALRESIGRHDLHQALAERETLGQELQKILDEKTNPWGITVQSVEIRDVQIPPDLQDAMSREAQAERERRARVILGTAETEIADKFARPRATYKDNPVALHLRAMNMLYEAIKEKGSMVIVPSSAVETMGLGGSLAAMALNKQS
jgi:regulator of protease activity HflC (stomatin/prohibitin superfamily)